MDVVYNHTRITVNSNFNQLVPVIIIVINPMEVFPMQLLERRCCSECPPFWKLESVMYWVRGVSCGWLSILMGVHDIQSEHDLRRAK